MPEHSEAVAPPKDNLVRSATFQLVRGEDDDDGLTLSGYGAVFNQWTRIDSWEGKFDEQIAPGAFRKTLRENGSRVQLQFDHGQHPLIGSMPIGKIRKLGEDPKGLHVEARLSDNWLIEPVRDAIRDGAVDGMSFRFTVEKEKWEDLEAAVPKRTITELRLHEVGPVVYPAYEGTSVGVRSKTIARELLTADETTRSEVARLVASEWSADDPDETEEEQAARQPEYFDGGALRPGWNTVTNNTGHAELLTTTPLTATPLSTTKTRTSEEAAPDKGTPNEAAVADGADKVTPTTPDAPLVLEHSSPTTRTTPRRLTPARMDADLEYVRGMEAAVERRLLDNERLVLRYEAENESETND